jgi:hypothetical protein
MKDRSTRLILKSFDVPLGKDEAELLERVVRASDVLRERRKFFTSLRKSIVAASYPPFEPEFVGRVVGAAFSSYDEFIRSLTISLRRVTFAAIVLSLLCTYYNLSESHTVNVAAAFGQPEPSIDQVLHPEATVE